MARKCKKGEVWNVKLKACKPATRKDKMEQAMEKMAYDPAKGIGTFKGALAGSTAHALLSNAGKRKGNAASLLASAIAGAAYGRYKEVKKQKKRDKELGIKKAPSRKIPKKYRKK
jgi:outer membrane lipoprotein SlyB